MNVFEVDVAKTVEYDILCEGFKNVVVGLGAFFLFRSLSSHFSIGVPSLGIRTDRKS